MPGYYKTEGVVLRTMRLREADRIVHLYTESRGRVGAVVKGVRRTRSRFGGRLEPFFRLSLVLYEGRGELHTITQAEAIEWFPRMREHHRSLSGAAAAGESVLRVFGEGGANSAAYNLLCNELRLLNERPEATGPANLLAFRLKLLLAAGFLPELSRCAGCGGEMTGREAGLLFSAANGGVLCGECQGGGFALQPAALSFMLVALGRPLKAAPEGTRPALAQVDRAVTETLEYHAHVRLKSVA